MPASPTTVDPNSLFSSGPVSDKERDKITSDMQESEQRLTSSDKVDDRSADDLFDAFETQKDGIDRTKKPEPKEDKQDEKTVDDKTKVDTEEDPLSKEEELYKAQKLAKRKASTESDKFTTKKAADSEDNQDDGSIDETVPITAKVVKNETITTADTIPPQFAKKMAKDAAEYVAAEFKRRNAEVESYKSKLAEAQKGELPPSWVEHDKAYTLLPEYQQTEAVINKVVPLIQHYKQQLAAIKAGKSEWVDVEEGPNENFIPVKRTLATPEDSANAEILLQERLYTASSSINELNQRKGALENNFKNYAQNRRNQAVELENKFFPQFQDPEVLKANKPYNTVMNLLQNGVGRGNTLAPFVAKMYALVADLVEENKKLSGGNTGAEVKNEVAARNGPGSGAFKGKSASSTITRPSQRPVEDLMAEFEKAKQGN